ncbi:MAG: hypothetical protein RSB25_09585 [Acinetobacter sp.]
MPRQTSLPERIWSSPYCKYAVTMKVTGLLSYIRPVDETTASGLDETFAHIVLNAYSACGVLSNEPIESENLAQRRVHITWVGRG